MSEAFIKETVELLCRDGNGRMAGSKGRQLAAHAIGKEMERLGLAVERQAYPCPAWQAGNVQLSIDGRRMPAVVNTYSLPCNVQGLLVAAASEEELASIDMTGKVVLLHGELSSEPYFPMNFDFYREEVQDRVLNLLQAGSPLAVIMASHRNATIIPLLEDSELLFPSVTVSAGEGKLLHEHSGGAVSLRVDSERTEGSGENLIGRKHGPGGKRVVVCAHYDTKYGTPGALDNASGVAAMLALAEELKGISLPFDVEFIAFGGEDSWYPGEALYVQRDSGNEAGTITAINIDSIGFRGACDTIAFLECPQGMMKGVMNLAKKFSGIRQAEPHYAGDHSLFWPRGIPSMVITSEACFGQAAGIYHTSQDVPELLDAAVIRRTVGFIKSILELLAANP